MPQTIPLTQTQQKALSLIATGSTIAGAASQAGVHRNTIGNWLRSSNFRQARELACLNQAIAWRDHAHQLAGNALAAISAILTDPKAPAAVRLRAALAILEKASAPLPKIPAQLCDAETSEPLPNSAQPGSEINRLPQPELVEMPTHAQPAPLNRKPLTSWTPPEEPPTCEYAAANAS